MIRKRNSYALVNEEGKVFEKFRTKMMAILRKPKLEKLYYPEKLTIKLLIPSPL